MSNLASKVLFSRCEELEKHAQQTADALAGRPGSEWERFDSAYDLAAIPVDQLFNRKDLNAAYIQAITAGGPRSAERLIAAKRQAEMLQALQRGTVMRYGRSRIWAAAAVYSRRVGMAQAHTVRRLPEFVASSQF